MIDKGLTSSPIFIQFKDIIAACQHLSGQFTEDLNRISRKYFV
jgi:hypothetical protein